MAEHNGNVSIAKEAVNAYSFLRRRETTDFMHDVLMRGAFAIGHNRAATRGAVVDVNAHPFWVNDKIVLVQNGTWYGDHVSATGYNTAVDSEAVAKVIEAEESIPKALAQLNAAYALVWYNVEKKELYMIRNKERPLCVALTTDEGMVLASEAEMISFACAKAGLKLKEKPYLIEENTLITITMDDGTWSLKNTKMKLKAPSAPKQQTITTVVQNMGRAMGARRGGGGSNRSANTHQHAVNPFEIHHYIHKGSFADWHVKDELLARKYQNEFYQKNQVYLEMIDFVPGEGAKECKVWHALFTELQATKDDPGPLFYATFKGTDEATLMKMIEQPFQITKTIGSPVIHVLTDQNHKKEFITAVKIVEFEPEVVADEAKIVKAIDQIAAAAGTVH